MSATRSRQHPWAAACNRALLDTSFPRLSPSKKKRHPTLVVSSWPLRTCTAHGHGTKLRQHTDTTARGRRRAVTAVSLDRPTGSRRTCEIRAYPAGRDASLASCGAKTATRFTQKHPPQHEEEPVRRPLERKEKLASSARSQELI